MRLLSAILTILVFTLFAQAQETPAPQANELAKLDVGKLLRPADSDKEAAKLLDVKVFRILPRETYDGKIDFRGGGAYYSFVTKVGTIITTLNPPNLVINSPSASTGFERTADEKYNTTALSDRGFPLEDARDRPGLPHLIDPHYYGYGSDIELQSEKFTVGFAGLHYGFLYDLGDMSLANVSIDTPAAVFLNSYQPPTGYAKIRKEQSKAFNATGPYQANGFDYHRTVPAVVGHTYLLRSIDFRRSDVLVALQVYRKDTDGSLIVFWKKLKTFDAPPVEREEKAK